MDRLVWVLAWAVVMAACGSDQPYRITGQPTPIESDRDDGFTDSDWEEFHDWCVVSRPRTAINCGGAANIIEHYITGGADEDCVVRNWKWMVGATTERELVVAGDALYRCSGMRAREPSLSVLNALNLGRWPDG